MTLLHAKICEEPQLRVMKISRKPSDDKNKEDETKITNIET